MATNNQAQSPDSGKMLVDHITSLRSFTGESREFWSFYLKDVAHLCKSELGLHFVPDEGLDQVVDEIYLVDYSEEDRQQLKKSFSEIFPRILRSGFAYERISLKSSSFANPFFVAYKAASVDGESKDFIGLVIDRTNLQQFNDSVVRTQLVSDIPQFFHLKTCTQKEASDSVDSPLLVKAFKVLDAVVSKDHLLLAAMTLVNEIAHRFSCSQVNLGCEKGKYIRVLSISHLGDFNRHSDAIRSLEGVFEEAFEQQEVLSLPKIGEGFVVDRAHQKYVEEKRLVQLISIPIMSEGKTSFVLTCEKMDGVLSPSEVDTIQLILRQVFNWLNYLHYRNKWFGSRLVQEFNAKIRSFFGVENSLIKMLSILATVLVVYSITSHWDYDIEGTATLKTDAVSYVSAPYDALIERVNIHEGDEVSQGEVLIELDTEELWLQYAQQSADLVRYMREAEKNRARNALADMKISESKIIEAQAGLDKLKLRLKHAEIKAQEDGIVVEADTQKLLGTPVSKGDLLMKVARIESMYFRIKISERDIKEIKKGASGRVLLLSRPDDVIPVIVEKTIPMAEVDPREGNVFILKARVEEDPRQWWRPGMSGVAKIEVGKRRIAWILTHRIVDFFRMFFWI